MDVDRIAALLGTEVTASRRLSGGCIADVVRLDLADGRRVVVKDGRPGDGLDLEGWMLTVLETRSALPVPHVHHAADDVLVMDWIEGGGALDKRAQEHAAELLAALHAVTAPDGLFGLERDTLIGGLHQPNPPTARWIDFFRDHRLLSMGREAMEAGRLPGRLLDRLETLCGRLDDLLPADSAPSLLHGDMWTGNVMVGPKSRIAGFIDPAVYYGDAEIELAFSTLFGTFGEPFFARYQEIRPLAPGFFQERRDLYNLYPLLVHVRLFGGSYVGSVERTLGRYGV